MIRWWRQRQLDRLKVASLRSLVTLEWPLAESEKRQALELHDPNRHVYALGRSASYQFVLDAIERRWP